ncbi:MAG: TetR family transcriptional regulator [Frankiales bacterium]|jgi:AcrR family transcriptional regulator|nr:TetR family transcriptional regulator [Frankiales bacterium]
MTKDGARPSARPRLSREIVLQAALRLVDEEGLDALTMRRLGQELDRDPMALYRYATSRAELLDGVAELVLAQLDMPTDVPDWQAQLRRTAHDFRQLALAHPNVVPLIVTRPLATPLALRPIGTLRPLEQMLELLVRAGYTPVRALHVYRSYWGLLHGHILNELQEVVVDPEETDALLRLGLHRLPNKDFPRLRGLAKALLAGYDGAAALDESLDLLLSGLTGDTPAPRKVRARKA